MWGGGLFLVSSPEPKAPVSYCHSAPSVRCWRWRLHVIIRKQNFHIFNFFSRTAWWILMKLDREGFSFDEILLQTIADNTCICIYLNPVILVVLLLTELFTVGYQVSDKRPLGLLFQCQLSAHLCTKAFRH